MRISHSFTLAAAAAAVSSTALAAPFSATQQPFVAFESGGLDPFAAGTASLLSSFWGEIKHAASWRLIQTSADEAPYWTTELGKHLLFLRGIKFMDVTEHQHTPDSTLSLSLQQQSSPLVSRPFPNKASHADFLKHDVFRNVSDAGPRENLAKFTSFTNRHYRSATGRSSQQWLLSKVKQIGSANPSIIVSEFEHDWSQNSIILHFPSTKKSLNAKPVIILGAHLDSTGFFSFMPAPGADDDGSGTSTLLEALRALLAAEWAPSGDYDIEWHWYSAEEGGLLGSQAIVDDYVHKQGRAVRAMMQQDMTAFFKPGTEEKVALVADFTDDKLTQFVEMLVKEYLDIPSATTKIGYAASDHASWMKAGVPAAFAVEGLYNDCNLQNIHTSSDTTTAQGYSFDHLVKFVKLTTAFAVELADQKA